MKWSDEEVTVIIHYVSCHTAVMSSVYMLYILPVTIALSVS